MGTGEMSWVEKRAWTRFLRSFARGGGFDFAQSSVTHLIRPPSVDGWQEAICGARALLTEWTSAPICDACWAMAKREFQRQYAAGGIR